VTTAAPDHDGSDGSELV